MERFIKKNPYIDKEFKRNCNFVAFRIPSKVSELIPHQKLLCQIIEENQGSYIIRNNILGDNGQINDIVSYVYAYF